MQYHHREAVSFIWSVADLLRGAYKAHDYGKIILPLTVIRRLDSALEPTKQAVLDRAATLPQDLENRDPVLKRTAGHRFYNDSPFTFARLIDDPQHLAENLRTYIRGFSGDARDIVDKFGFDNQIDKLDRASLLYPVIAKFCGMDFDPQWVSNTDMGYIFEELIRKFAEASNETAGEHFTPREVIRLMVDLLFIEDRDLLTTPGRIVTMYDPAAGTGGMLSVADQHLAELNADATLVPFGQEWNEESYAICKADLLIKGQDASNIAFGNSFTEDGFPHRKFDYTIANPPYGVSWGGYAAPVEAEYERLGASGRFGPGLPSKTDGQLLFVLHMVSKLKPYDPETGEGGGRLAIVMNGSPLFTGAPGGGESQIRRHLIENDMLEAVIGLPDRLFYNTGINTYVWIITNRKSSARRGKVQLIDARDLYRKMRKSLGDKRHELGDDHIEQIDKLYGDLVEDDRSTLLPNEAFGFRRITLERPKRARYEGGQAAVQRLVEHPDWADERAVRKSSMEGEDRIRATVLEAVRSLGTRSLDLAQVRKELQKLDAFKALGNKAERAVFEALTVGDPTADAVRDAVGNYVADPDLRGQETVPLPDGYDPHDHTVDVLRVGIDHHVEREVKPHAPDAWVDHAKTKVGYEIPFTRIFYTYLPPRPLKEIDSDIRKVEQEILKLLAEVTE